MSEKDGGPAFPTVDANRPADFGTCGMTLRDFFATTLPADSVQEITFRCLSRMAQEELIGRKYPAERPDYAPGNIEYQLEKMCFQIDVDAAIRYIHADSMLEARKS